MFALTHTDSRTQFLSLQGNDEVDDALYNILSFSHSYGLLPALELIPEEVVLAIEKPDGFIVTADRDNFDYMLSTSAVAELEGSTFRNVRQAVNRFRENYNNATFVELDLSDTDTVRQILDIFTARSFQSKQPPNAYELHAMTRLIGLQDEFALEARGIRVNDELKAFIILERNRRSLLGHFWKANTAYKGIYQFLMQQCCSYFADLGYEQINIEEDMGIPGLREAKKHYNPSFLKKYVIALPVPQHAALEEGSRPEPETLLSSA